ncbi:MAG TPA: fibronectin type III domain-containing protein, partial [Solirubrobacterales bacterium]|nr:fibronectin type III domain-containing protein [Solirubrobacterales bacterium]
KAVIQQFGPGNPPGLTAPPAAADDQHGGGAYLNYTANLGLDVGNGRLFVSTFTNVGGPPNFDGTGYKSGVYVLDLAGGEPSVSLDSVDGVTASSATLHGAVNPHGGPPVSYSIEYSTDGSNWNRTGETIVGTQETPQQIDPVLNPPPGGLQPNTFYHVRLAATKAFTQPVLSAEMTFTTAPSQPSVETVGSPLRTATTARLEGRLNPLGSAASYHFEYGSEGPCDSNPCASTASLAASDGQTIEFVSQPVEGLVPGTTYHYRLVAENAGGQSFGDDGTLTTRTSDKALDHGSFPGPPDSDRAWEQVNLPNTGGNPVLGGYAFSDDGERAIYQVGGGNPITDSGSAFSLYYAERGSGGWQSRTILPGRSELVGPSWAPPIGSGDLTSVFSVNSGAEANDAVIAHLRPFATPQALLRLSKTDFGGFLTSSDDGSRLVALLRGGSFDPAHPVAPGADHLYDLTSGTPKLVSLMPGGTVPPCSVTPTQDRTGLPGGSRRPEHWLSADGRLLVFPSKGSECVPGSPFGASQLYLRDLVAEETVRITGSPTSGSSCRAALLKQTPGAVFFWTQARLDPEDTVGPTDCAGIKGGDVYRYDIGAGTRQCVTCAAPGLDADVNVELGAQVSASVAIAGDGSRVYFGTSHRLLPGAPLGGIYRVAVSSGELAYVAPLEEGGTVGDGWMSGNALTPDGSVLIFRSPLLDLNPRNGLQNGGLSQYYRYDDRDRSLTCVTCPLDGSAPSQAASLNLASRTFGPESGPNVDPLDDSGEVFVFPTVDALVGADQNTPGPGLDPASGTDVYEWRDGRYLLISDGLTNWPHREIAPAPSGVSPDGRNVYFTASAQYTPDAVDGYNRLYDARIGGGIEFPRPPKPCPLEVCQGTPKGAPAEQPPGTGSLSGAGNSGPAGKGHRRCAKGKVRRKGRCVKKHPRNHQKKHRRTANDNRRTTR